MQFGNKLEVIRKLVDVLEYIEENQNSADILPYKEIIMKMISTMSTSFIESQKIVEPKEPQQEDSGCNSCDSNSCDANHEPERILPIFDVDEAVAKVKAEMSVR